MVVEVIDARRPRIQENGRDIAIAPAPIFPICSDEYQEHDEATERFTKKSRKKLLGRSIYQKLLQKAKVSEHANNHKNWDILPDPIKIHTKFQHFNLSNWQSTKCSEKKPTLQAISMNRLKYPRIGIALYFT